MRLNYRTPSDEYSLIGVEGLEWLIGELIMKVYTVNINNGLQLKVQTRRFVQLGKNRLSLFNNAHPNRFHFTERLLLRYRSLLMKFINIVSNFRCEAGFSHWNWKTADDNWFESYRNWSTFFTRSLNIMTRSSHERADNWICNSLHLEAFNSQWVAN